LERVCFTFDLRPGTEAEYERRHAEIWPELVLAITAAGFRNHSLFRRRQQVIAYAECHPSVAAAFEALSRQEVSRRWGETFADVIVSMHGPDGELVRLEEVWHLD
jgi:L-rhamnose mutarotase